MTSTGMLLVLRARVDELSFVISLCTCIFSPIFILVCFVPVIDARGYAGLIEFRDLPTKKGA